jgi:hypothetical protein
MKKAGHESGLFFLTNELDSLYCLGGLCANAFGSNGVTGPVM